jgi:hypothetical protein
MNEMNSLTHSCMHSLASLAIFAFSGRAVFIIRATGAKLRMLASESPACFLDLEARLDSGGGGEEDSWDMIGRLVAVVHQEIKRWRSKLNEWPNSRTCAYRQM